jgi:hypothetical protein
MYPSRTREESKSRHYRQHNMPICMVFVEALWRTRTADPLLTIKVRSQAVATHGNRIGLFTPFAGPAHLPPVATGCAR